AGCTSWAYTRLRERVMRDRTNPLDIYGDRELIERFRFSRVELLELINDLSPQLQHATDRNGALSPTLQVLISLRFYASGSFQNTFADMVNVSRSTACRAIRRVDSPGHISHIFTPISEAVSSYKEELITTLKPLRQKLKLCEYIKSNYTCVHSDNYIKSQAEQTECQIKQQFEKLHQFLRNEEKATIAALRKEEEQKQQMIEKLNRDIAVLSHTIKDMEEMMEANDVYFLKKFPGSMERVQISQPDACTLIDVPRYLGNLTFRVWKKMQAIVQNTPVILDPNTAHPDLMLSDDLTKVNDFNVS
ncbi:hypothetical protein QQF64_025605, partial [Cirrhinus molitorella]